MKFTLNGDEWTVKLVSLIDGNQYKFGETDYSNLTISIKRDLPETTKRKTFIHEFTHAWQYATGRIQDEDSKYNYEEVCCMFEHLYPVLESILPKFDEFLEKGE